MLGVLHKVINSKTPIVWTTIQFCLVIILVGYLNPGYSHVHQAISELGAPNANYAWITRWFAFVPLGIGFITLAFNVWGQFTGRLPFILFLFTGIAIVAAGIFPTDPNGRRDTFSGMTHAIAGIILLFILSLTPLTLSRRALYKHPSEKWLLGFSFVMGIIVSTFFIMLPNGISPQLVGFHERILGDYFKIWYPMHGLHQRLLLSVYFIWLLVFIRYSPDAR
jgi:hypothetical membrane protein